MARLSWSEDAVSAGAVCERGFAVERNEHVIPGVLWYPANHWTAAAGIDGSWGERTQASRPYGDARTEVCRRLRLVCRRIDGPVHGGVAR